MVLKVFVPSCMFLHAAGGEGWGRGYASEDAVGFYVLSCPPLSSHTTPHPPFFPAHSHIMSDTPLTLQTQEEADTKDGVDTQATQTLTVGDTLKFEKLGPIIINTDGTTSRIANWENMGQREQDVTWERIAKRNEGRLKVLRTAEAKGSGGSGA